MFIDKSGYIGEIKKHTSKARLDIKYVTIKNKICLVENKNGDTMKYKLVDFDDSYMMCWRRANYINDKGQKVYRKWTLKIDRYSGELFDDFELWNEIGEINPLDDEKPLKYDLHINGKYKCEKANKLF